MNTDFCESCSDEGIARYRLPSVVIYEGEGWCGAHALKYVGAEPDKALRHVEEDLPFLLYDRRMREAS